MNKFETLLIKEAEEYKDLAERLIDDRFLAAIKKAAGVILDAFSKGRKVLIFGNGGSAAEAEHFAAELVGRFCRGRKALPALALVSDSAFITAQANDVGYATVFSRQVEALANAGDVVMGMTTSDFKGSHSLNVREGFIAARKKGAKTVGLFSAKTKKLLKLVDCAVVVPHTSTPRIQEVHLFAIHAICRVIDDEILRHS